MTKLKETLGAITAALGAVGVLVYAAQRVAYERFYDEFGLTPEDVGVTATSVLSQTAVGLAAWVLVASAPTVVAFALAAWKFDVEWNLVLWSVLGVVVVMTAICFFASASNADDAAKCAKRADGQPVRSLRIRLPGTTITTLGVRADRAVLRWLNPDQGKRFHGRSVVYLGATGGFAIVHDPASRRTLRVPASAVVVSSDAAAARYRIRKGCQPVT